MPHSDITELWRGVQDVVNLARMDLRECKRLKNLPNLSKASKLMWVNLSGCESLRDVHPSILSIHTLKTLILDGCKKLRSLKSKMHFRYLEDISVIGCTSLREFSVSSDSIRSLDLSNTGIERLDSSISRQRYIRSLNVQGLRVGNLPSELSFLERLRELRICNCKISMNKKNLHVIFDGLQSLVLLHLKDCCNLSELPDNISNLYLLEELRLDGSNVQTLPASIGTLFSLRTLSVENCRMLTSLPELPPNFLECNFFNCTSLETVSISMTHAINITYEGRFILFEDCKRIGEHSLCCIMDYALLAMDSAAWMNISMVNVCLPGSRVPKRFSYRSTSSSVTVNLPSSQSNFVGLMFCVVLSPSCRRMKFKGAKIWCQCYLADGTKLGRATSWDYKIYDNWLSSGHTYIWSDVSHFSSNILKIYKMDQRQVSFQFYVTKDDMGRKHGVLSTINLQECGVCLIFDSEEFRRPLLELHRDRKRLKPFNEFMMTGGKNLSKEDHYNDTPIPEYSSRLGVVGFLQFAPLVFNGENYDLWAVIMESYL